MQTKTLLSASLIAIAAATSTAQAGPQEAIDRIVGDLSGQGYVRIEIDIERDGSFDVEAYGGGREGDFHYDAQGWLLDADVEEDDTFGAGYTGGAPGRADDDRRDDDDRDDDEDDGRDDDDDGSAGGGYGGDRDDDDDDDGDDDGDGDGDGDGDDGDDDDD